MKNSNQQWLTTWVDEDMAESVQAITDQFGVSKHKVTSEALALGLDLAKYKIALERVIDDKLNFRSL